MRLHAFLSCRHIVVASALLLVAVPAWGMDTRLDRPSLKGITTVKVMISGIESDAQQDGLSRDQLQTDVELRLRQSGITVDPSSQVVLYLEVYARKTTVAPLYVIAVKLELLQPVRLNRDPTISHVAARTWSAENFGSVGAGRLAELRPSVIDLVDTFINAYLEQNPKP